VREQQDVRIFFALWPDDATRNHLDKTAGEMLLPASARAVPAYNLHLTLHFIGNVKIEQMLCLQQQARGVKNDAFDLTVDIADCFRQPKVAWLGCGEIPRALTGLHQKLGRALGKCAYQPESRPYNPHVTVARKVVELSRPVSFEPILWRVNQFTLINSRSTSEGVIYEVVETFELEN
jgi:2'-5' RNA ligase